MNIKHDAWVNFFCALIIIIALSVLTGWIFDIYFLKSLSFNRVSMKPNTAICFLICGILLLGILNDHKIIERILSLLVGAVGLVTLIEYIFNVNAGIEQLIVKESVNAVATSSPGRMAPVTALNFFIIGFCFFNPDKKINLRQSLMGLVLVIGLFSLYGHLFNLHESEKSARYTIVSIPDAISFSLVVFAYFFKTPDKGFSHLFFNHSAGAVIFKWLALPILTILPLLFYLRFLGEQAGWFGTLYGISLMATVSVTFLFLLILFTSEKLNAMERILKISQINLNTIFEHTNSGFMLINNDFIVQEFNNRFQHFSTVTLGNVFEKNSNFLNYLPESRKETFLSNYKKVLKGEHVNYEIAYPKLGGGSIIFSLYLFPVFDNEGNTIGCCIKTEDITERKKIEQKAVDAEKQIRGFAQHLNNILEEERTSLAREIHDELAQQCVGLMIGISSFKRFSEIEPAVEEQVKGMLKDVSGVMQSMRRIATELRPGILDSLGLIPSLKWLAEEFQRKTKILCVFETNSVQEKFDKKISTHFFRICQEALTNITKHAQASRVTVAVKHDNNSLSLRITDNGKGIACEKIENPFSMGLLGMRERATSIGTELFIESELNKGTTISISKNL